jgi:hypothetical protein
VSHFFLLLSLSLFLLFPHSTLVDHHVGGRKLMIASDKPAAPAVTEQISGQVVSVCMALGVSREHTELVMRVIAACTRQTDSVVRPAE